MDKATLKKIEPIIYPSSIAHFRARMDRLLAVKWDIISIGSKGQSRKYSISYYSYAKDLKREIWNVFPSIPVVGGLRSGDSRFAMILAIEDRPDNTVVEFVDGKCYERTAYHYRSSSAEVNFSPAHLFSGEPIGGDFVLIANMISDEFQKSIKENNASPLEKWEFIPNIGWTRQALKLWHEGFSTSEIGIRVGKNEQTVRNKIADLRSNYGDDIVPRRRK